MDWTSLLLIYSHWYKIVSSFFVRIMEKHLVRRNLSCTLIYLNMQRLIA